VSEELLKPLQVAERWGVSRSWVYRAAEEGRIPHLRLGGTGGPLRFSPAAISHFEEQARRPGAVGKLSDEPRRDQLI
jgi:excisionase family DNA binding protein